MTIRRSYWLLLLLALLLSVPTRGGASVAFISQDDNGREFTLDRGDALKIFTACYIGDRVYVAA